MAAQRSRSCRCCSRGSATPTTYAVPIDGGVDGIYCSNHGGRQANGGTAAIDLLPGVVDAAGRTAGAVRLRRRSGADVVKALALGATAVGIGRPYGYGAVLGGAAGIEVVLSACSPRPTCRWRSTATPASQRSPATSWSTARRTGHDPAGGLGVEDPHDVGVPRRRRATDSGGSSPCRRQACRRSRPPT